MHGVSTQNFLSGGSIICFRRWGSDKESAFDRVSFRGSAHFERGTLPSSMLTGQNFTEHLAFWRTRVSNGMKAFRHAGKTVGLGTNNLISLKLCLLNNLAYSARLFLWQQYYAIEQKQGLMIPPQVIWNWNVCSTTYRESLGDDTL